MKQTNDIGTMFFIGFIILMGVIFIILAIPQHISGSCTISGINFATERYTDSTFDTKKISLDNSTITCTGDAKVSLWLLILSR
jgi:hypothetical protein